MSSNGVVLGSKRVNVYSQYKEMHQMVAWGNGYYFNLGKKDEWLVGLMRLKIFKI
jgi:hypothetical protein